MLPLTLFPLLAFQAAFKVAAQPPYTKGLNVSDAIPPGDFATVADAPDSELRFVFIRATYGRNGVDTNLGLHNAAAINAGLVRGFVHEAHPLQSSGAVQARHLFNTYGTFIADNAPGQAACPIIPRLAAVEITTGRGLGVIRSPDPLRDELCYGLSVQEYGAWLKSFADEWKDITERWPIIKVSKSIWDICLESGNILRQRLDIGSCPLWIIDWERGTQEGPRVPSPWITWQFWSYSWQEPPLSGSWDYFNGNAVQLLAFSGEGTPGQGGSRYADGGGSNGDREAGCSWWSPERKSETKHDGDQFVREPEVWKYEDYMKDGEGRRTS